MGEKVASKTRRVATTPLLDLNSEIGKALYGRCHAFACQQLSAGDPEFKRLYDQVEREDSPHVMGSAVAGSAEAFAAAFPAWIEKQGLSLKDDKKKTALHSGDAQNPMDGTAFRWCVFIYSDLRD